MTDYCKICGQELPSEVKVAFMSVLYKDFKPVNIDGEKHCHNCAVAVVEARRKKGLGK